MADLYDYQEGAVRRLVELGGCGGLFLAMGTGKTRTALEIARRLRCRKILIVAPLSAIGGWKLERSLFWPRLSLGNASVGTLARRAELLRTQEHHAFLVGYETYWKDPLSTEIIKWQPDMVIYDEAHRLKGRSSRRSRFAARLVHVVPYRLGLTGTPVANGPEDLFGIYRALDPRVFGTVWLNFEGRYIVKGGYFNYEIVGYRNVLELRQKVASTSVRVTKAQALQLPPQVDVTIPVQLGAKARKVYGEMKKKAIAEVEGMIRGRAAAGVTLSRSILTNVLRLQSITGGWTKLSDGRVLDISSEKQDVLVDFLEDATPQVGRVVVFCRFRHDIDRLVEALAGREHTFVLDGRVPPEYRDELLDNFRAANYGYLIAQIAVASLGIDLTCSYTGVFYSPDYSLANFLQSRSRLHRHGQKHKVTYYHLVAEDTIDGKVYEALRDKADVARDVLAPSRVLELFR